MIQTIPIQNIPERKTYFQTSSSRHKKTSISLISKLPYELLIKHHNK